MNALIVSRRRALWLLAASLRLRSPFSVSSAPLPAKPGLSAKSGFFWAAAGAMESAVASSSAVTA